MQNTFGVRQLIRQVSRCKPSVFFISSFRLSSNNFDSFILDLAETKKSGIPSITPRSLLENDDNEFKSFTKSSTAIMSDLTVCGTASVVESDNCFKVYRECILTAFKKTHLVLNEFDILGQH
uniref:Uncharacterized protein n=1 Tax=Caenorhabditis japonica TaxID=281687 RepID=A0A8R1IQK5_CAEJA